jgi:hypothetical protein
MEIPFSVLIIALDIFNLKVAPCQSAVRIITVSQVPTRITTVEVLTIIPNLGTQNLFNGTPLTRRYRPLRLGKPLTSSLLVRHSQSFFFNHRDVFNIWKVLDIQ